MLSSSNVFFLFFLAVVSWILLCVINSRPTEQTLKFMKEADKSNDMLKLWIRRILSTMFTKGPNLTIYLLCTLLGVFILINVIARKVKTIAILAARNEGYSNLLVQISRLKEENARLLSLLKKQKVEKKILVRHININAVLIHKLKAEMCLMKEKYERIKEKSYSATKESNKMAEDNSSTSGSMLQRSKDRITEKYCMKSKSDYSDSVFALKSSDIINEILKETYDNRTYVMLNKMHSIQPISHDSDLYEDEMDSNRALKELSNINIVSTDQLQKIKGSMLSSFFPNFT